MGNLVNNDGIMEQVMDLDELLKKYNNEFDKITEDEWMFLSQNDKDRYESRENYEVLS